MIKTENRMTVADRLLHWALLASFVLTMLVPLTGVHLHKMFSLVFLLLSGIHTVKYRRKLTGKRVLLFLMIVAAFFSGIFGMVMDHTPMVLQLHKALSIGLTAFLAIHIFVFHRRIFGKGR